MTEDTEFPGDELFEFFIEPLWPELFDGV